MSILSDEVRAMLVDSANKFINAEYAFENRQKLAKSELGFSKDHWQTISELGWLSIPFEEELGGLGGSISDMAGLAEVLGRGLILEPWFASIVLSGQVIANSTNLALKEQLIPSVVSGESILALAWEERCSGANPLQLEASAIRNGETYEITGNKCLIQAAPQASGLVVTAMLDNDIALFYLPTDTEGLILKNYALVDGSRAADLELNQVCIDKSSCLTLDGAETLKTAIDNAAYLACCEALGCMETLLQTTADYMKQRHQFGQPIANFQALRHMLADMYVMLKKTRCYLETCTATLRAGHKLSEEQIAVLKVQTGRAAHHIGRQSIQIHGGIGMTDELKVGHYVKRLTAIDATLGNGRYHLQSLADAL